MHSTYNEGKLIARILKNKIYKYVTSVPKNVYIDKVDGIVINTAIHITAKSK